MYGDRVLSGMRPTGALHIGHFHGALKNWVKLQDEHPCFFFVADWHALTTHYETPEDIEASVWDMLVDWFAAGIDPPRAPLGGMHELTAVLLEAFGAPAAAQGEKR
jgi:tryptophanyl-tRNA synthetase